MTGQAYAARSPRYWVWVVGALVLFGGGGFAWHLLAESAEATPIVTGARPVLPSQRAPRALPVAVAAPASAEMTSGDSEVGELAARIVQLEGELAAANEKAEQFRVALSSVSQQLQAADAQSNYYRKAIEEALAARGAAPPRRLAEARVRHLGQPNLTPLGSAWLVSGTWYNLGDAEAYGFADVQLVLNGRRVGNVQSLRLGPIAPGATLGYQARFDTEFEHQGKVVTGSAVWRPD